MSPALKPGVKSPGPELLSPAGKLKSMHYAFAYGADAVYAGLPRYSLRARSNDFDSTNLKVGIEEAHARGRRFYLACNLMPHGAKLATFLRDMEPVIAIGPDALIMADPGLILLIRERWPQVPIHQYQQLTATSAWSRARCNLASRVARRDRTRACWLSDRCTEFFDQIAEGAHWPLPARSPSSSGTDRIETAPRRGHLAFTSVPAPTSVAAVAFHIRLNMSRNLLFYQGRFCPATKGLLQHFPSRKCLEQLNLSCFRSIGTVSLKVVDTLFSKDCGKCPALSLSTEASSERIQGIGKYRLPFRFWLSIPASLQRSKAPCVPNGWSEEWM